MAGNMKCKFTQASYSHKEAAILHLSSNVGLGQTN